jgi:hypothetical protein
MRLFPNNPWAIMHDIRRAHRMLTDLADSESGPLLPEPEAIGRPGPTEHAWSMPPMDIYQTDTEFIAYVGACRVLFS